MRRVVIWILALLATTGLATLMLYDNGVVSVVWGQWVIETSLSFFMGLVLLFFTLGYLLVRLSLLVWNFPRYWQHRRRFSRLNQAQDAMTEGMIALEYGEWHKAEKALIRSAKRSESGLVHYLSAAKMAQNQGAVKRRDAYLQEAREAYPQEYLLIGLVEARLLLEQAPWEALALLQALHEQAPSHQNVLQEYAKVLVQLKQWPELEALMPRIQKSKALVREALWSLQRSLLAGKLATAKEVDVLDALWYQLPAKAQMEAEILAEFVEQRIGFGQEVGLEKLLEKALARHWDDRLVYQYGRLTLGPAFERMKKAEAWLKTQPQNPILLLTLGRLACCSQMWALGKSYLQQSLKLAPQLETFHALAHCYEAQGKEEQAALVYKEAIEQLKEAGPKRLLSQAQV